MPREAPVINRVLPESVSAIGHPPTREALILASGRWGCLAPPFGGDAPATASAECTPNLEYRTWAAHHRAILKGRKGRYHPSPRPWRTTGICAFETFWIGVVAAGCVVLLRLIFHRL